MAPPVYNSNNQAAATLVRVAEKEVSRLLGSLEKVRQEVADKKIALEAQYGKDIPIRELKQLDNELYRELQRNGKAFKSLRRGLGSLVTTMPEFLGDNGLLGNLEKVIDKGPGGFKNEGAYINKIKNVLDNWDNNLAFYKEGVNKWTGEAMTVGHHEISLSTLRDELLDLGKTTEGFNYRKAILKLAKERGFHIGEEFVQHIDPVAHKFEKTLKGRLLKLFPEGTNFNDPKFDTLFKQLSDRYSHAYWGGSTTGIDIPVGTIPRGGTPAQGLSSIQDSLIIQQAATESGVDIHKLLNESLDKLEKGQLPKDPDQLLAILSKNLSELPIPDVEPEWRSAFQKGIVSKSRYGDIITSFQNLKANPANIFTRPHDLVAKGINVGVDFNLGVGMGIGIGLLTDENYQKFWNERDYLGLAQLGARDEAISQAVFRTGGWLMKTPWGQAVTQTVSPYVSKAAPVAIPAAIGAIQHSGESNIREKYDADRTGNIGSSLFSQPIGYTPPGL